MAGPVMVNGRMVDKIRPLIWRYWETSVLVAMSGLFPSSLPAEGEIKPAARIHVETAGNFVAGCLWDELRSGELEGIFIPGDDSKEGLLLWKELPWDSEVLDRRCAKISLLAGYDTSRLLSFWKEMAADRGVEYATVRILGRNCCRVMDTSRLTVPLEETGFRKLERLRFYSRSSSSARPGHLVEMASTEDRDEIVDIAGVAYQCDRFHREPFFTSEGADDVHRKWAVSSFSGRADAVLKVSGEGGRILGFCTCILPDQTGFPGWIDMLAVRPEERGEGVGRSLITGALSYFRESGRDRVALSTQDKNSAAIKLYRSIGFRNYGSAETYRIVLGQD